MKHPELTLEEKVAQLFFVGSDQIDPGEEIDPFYRYGLGGLLLFRHHLQPFATALELREFLNQQKRKFRGSSLSFIGIDQEGGTVERLPHWLFPTGIMPVVYGLKQDQNLCQQVNREIARRMRWLGINLNFTPTVDLNREMMNPIIGVRAYGEKNEQVIPLARLVMRTHLDAGVLPVAKHFPGHGSGTVDSHEALPVFESWTEEELVPYEVLIQENLPGVLVAHGLYPRLNKMLDGDPRLPASLSEAIVTHLLRDKLKFQGLIFSDDLMMGAVWNDMDPVEVALRALGAGTDMLVYRRAQPEAWSAFETIVSRVQQGKISERLIDAKVERILACKAFMDKAPVYDYQDITLSEEACHALSLQWAQQGLVELHHQFVSPLPLSHRTRWGLVAPDRNTMRHYQPDSAHGKDLSGWCQYYGIVPTVQQYYPVDGIQPFTPDAWADTTLEAVVFIAFNSQLHPLQQHLYEQLKNRHPEAKVILASCGIPVDREVLSKPWIHVQLPSFRPAGMQAFIQWLITPPAQSLPG